MVYIIGILLISFVFVAAITKANLDFKSGEPTQGDLICPFCRAFIARKVWLTGQQSHCPKCHSSFHAHNLQLKTPSLSLVVPLLFLKCVLLLVLFLVAVNWLRGA